MPSSLPLLSHALYIDDYISIRLSSLFSVVEAWASSAFSLVSFRNTYWFFTTCKFLDVEFQYLGLSFRRGFHWSVFCSLHFQFIDIFVYYYRIMRHILSYAWGLVILIFGFCSTKLLHFETHSHHIIYICQNDARKLLLFPITILIDILSLYYFHYFLSLLRDIPSCYATTYHYFIYHHISASPNKTSHDIARIFTYR